MYYNSGISTLLVKKRLAIVANIACTGFQVSDGLLRMMRMVLNMGLARTEHGFRRIHSIRIFSHLHHDRNAHYSKGLLF